MLDRGLDISQCLYLFVHGSTLVCLGLYQITLVGLDGWMDEQTKQTTHKLILFRATCRLLCSAHWRNALDGKIQQS